MADGFRIPFQEAESEFVEKRSRFISHVWRVETEEGSGGLPGKPRWVPEIWYWKSDRGSGP